MPIRVINSIFNILLIDKKRELNVLILNQYIKGIIIITINILIQFKLKDKICVEGSKIENKLLIIVKYNWF